MPDTITRAEIYKQVFQQHGCKDYDKTAKMIYDAGMRNRLLDLFRKAVQEAKLQGHRGTFENSTEKIMAVIADMSKTMIKTNFLANAEQLSSQKTASGNTGKFKGGGARINGRSYRDPGDKNKDWHRR